MELIQYYHTPSQEELNSSVYITWAGHRVCKPDHRIGPRVLQTYKIVLILKGRGTLIQDDTIYNLNKGDMFVLFPNVKHLYYTDQNHPWELMWVCFNGNICENIISQMQLYPQNPVLRNISSENIVDLLQKIIDYLHFEQEPYALQSTGYLYLLFSEMMGINRKSDENKNLSSKEIIEKAITFIDLNYYNNINVDLLCHYVNYSRSYLSRLFKKAIGLSIPEYINSVRMEKAKTLLRHTNLNINEVSRSVGFCDPFYFSRIFKKAIGESPQNYKSGSIEKI